MASFKPEDNAPKESAAEEKAAALLKLLLVNFDNSIEISKLANL
ncbi:hypothetical protein TURTL08_13150 [Turicimonas sp. TL08]